MNVSSPHTDTPRWVASILDNRATWLIARIALTLPFWWSGIDKAMHPQTAQAEIVGLLGTTSPGLPYIVLLLVQLGGSVLVILNRWSWLGAGVLGVFTLIVTILAHDFWNLDGPARFAEMNTFLEHTSIIAGFVFAAMVAHRDSRQLSRYPEFPRSQ